MNKFHLAFLLFSMLCHSQTGIGINEPNSTLHIKANKFLFSALKITDPTTNVDVFDIGNGGTITLPKYKNVSILATDENGALKQGTQADLSTLSIPTLITIGTRSATSGQHNGNIEYAVDFTISKNNASYITYNKSIFTVVKPGYYNVATYCSYDVSMNIAPRGGTASTKISKSGITTSRSMDTLADTSTESSTYLGSTDYYNKGDTIEVITNYTRSFRTDLANITIIYFGL